MDAAAQKGLYFLRTFTYVNAYGQIPPDLTSWKPAQKLVFDQVSNLLETPAADKSQTSHGQVESRFPTSRSLRQVGNLLKTGLSRFPTC